MNWKSIPIACAAAALMAPTPALAQSSYSLRNDTRHARNCRLDRPHSAAAERIVLRPAQEWSSPARARAPRRLVCDAGAFPLVANIWPGARYAIVLDAETGRLLLRFADPR